MERLPLPNRVSDETELNRFDGIIKIITNNRCKTIYQSEFESKITTLKDCIDIAMKELKAETTEPIIIVIAETPLEGCIYRYGNREEMYWEQIGTTCGYA